MPIWLRIFTLQKMNKHYEDKKEAQEKASGKQKLGTKPPTGPDIKPDYTTKARK